MTKDETIKLIKRVCQGNRQTYERAQKKATPESKWPQIWGNCENAIDLVEGDLLRELDKCDKTKAQGPDMSAMDVLGIVCDVCQEEREHCAEMINIYKGCEEAVAWASRLHEINISQTKIESLCRERGLIYRKREAA